MVKNKRAGAGRKLHLTNVQRSTILQALLCRVFKVSRHTVQQIWKQAKESLVDGSAMVVDNCWSNCGRKKKDHAEAFDGMDKIPTDNQGTVRGTALIMGLSTWAVWSHSKEKDGPCRQHSVLCIPILTDVQVQARINYCISHIRAEARLF